MSTITYDVNLNVDLSNNYSMNLNCKLNLHPLDIDKKTRKPFPCKDTIPAEITTISTDASLQTAFEYFRDNPNIKAYCFGMPKRAIISLRTPQLAEPYRDFAYLEYSDVKAITSVLAPLSRKTPKTLMPRKEQIELIAMAKDSDPDRFKYIDDPADYRLAKDGFIIHADEPGVVHFVSGASAFTKTVTRYAVPIIRNKTITYLVNNGFLKECTDYLVHNGYLLDPRDYVGANYTSRQW